LLKGTRMSHYDDLETRDPAARERSLMLALPGQVEHAQRHSPGFARLLAGVDAKTIASRAALAGLPVVRKSELKDLQRGDLPFAGLCALPPGALGRVYASPGPTYDPEGRRADYWRLARALFAAGFRPNELVHNCFAYHFTPAGFMVDLGAQALGCAVFPGGTGNTELQVAAISDLRPAGYAGTPSFLRIIIEKADELGADISSLKRALVAAEALPPSLRAQFDARGIRTLQCYASADLGLIAYESEAKEGMIVDEGVIVEIVRPGTGDPVGEGEVGEVLVTTLTPEYPLIRFATGDLSALLPGASPCGRTNVRIKGWLGRADQTTKVRGMFVHPSQVAEVTKRHPQIVRARLIVEFDDHKSDRMTLHCELSSGSVDVELASRVAGSLRDVCKLRGEVAFAAPGALPNDGKVIDDTRKYE
jgi:phenylacetate-CoA ligase